MKKFFILSIGRSGTKFLANLLNKSSNSVVLHEPYKSDKRIYKEKYLDDNLNHMDYLTLRFLELSEQNPHILDYEVYGEVNSFLRRHCDVLSKFTPSKLVHLVRDGRDVVRSLMSRETMTSYDKNTNFIEPKENDPYKDDWYKMNRFERCCWYWKTENEYLSKYINHFVNFELLISDFDYIQKKLLNYINVNLQFDVWKSKKSKPKNKTGQYLLSDWKDWTPIMKTKFEQICGDEMKKYGYL